LAANRGIVKEKKTRELRALKLRHGEMPTVADKKHKAKKTMSGAAIWRDLSGMFTLTKLKRFVQAQRTIRGESAM
jgi:hypothetical protein